MDITQLRYFIAVCDNQSFSKASEVCFVSQSAISQQILSLEKELGVLLLVREPRKVTPTSSGRYLYEKGKLLIKEVDLLKDQTKWIASEDRRQLKIGYLHSYAGNQLYQAVHHFTKLHPEIAVQLVSGTHNELVDLNYQNEIDIMFSEQRKAFSNTYHNFHLGTNYVYIEMSANHPLVQKEKVTVSDLSSSLCLVIANEKAFIPETKHLSLYFGLDSEFKLVHSYEEARNYLLANKDAFLLVEKNEVEEARESVLCSFPLYEDEGEIATRDYYAFWPKKRENELLQEFAEVLKSYF